MNLIKEVEFVIWILEIFRLDQLQYRICNQKLFNNSVQLAQSIEKSM